jgi:hypothetical protein
VTPDGNGEVTVNFGLLPRNANEIALLKRSMVEILLEVAAGIEVPVEHVAQGRTASTTCLPNAEDPRDRPIIRIQSSVSPPATSYAAVRYRDTMNGCGRCFALKHQTIEGGAARPPDPQHLRTGDTAPPPAMPPQWQRDKLIDSAMTVRA